MYESLSWGGSGVDALRGIGLNSHLFFRPRGGVYAPGEADIPSDPAPCWIIIEWNYNYMLQQLDLALKKLPILLILAVYSLSMVSM